ncbi:MAG: glutamate racemase [bacterium]
MEKVGFFDSGVGGLTVLEASRETISNLSYYYLGDTKHCPYGDRPLAEVRQFALNAVGFLREQDCSQIVMACNISSSIALKPARRQFPDLTIHGLINEDLVNHIKSVTDNGHVGVMATTGTVNSGFYPQQLEPAGLSVHQQACSPLVPMIEAGHHSGPLVRQTLEPLLSPLIKQNVDTLVLGCTHYPFLTDVINDLTNNEINLVDPGRVMANRLKQSLSDSNGEKPAGTFAATGETESLKEALEHNFNRTNVTIEQVTPKEAPAE